MSCQDKPLDSNSSNQKPDTRAGEPRQRPLPNLAGGHFSANSLDHNVMGQGDLTDGKAWGERSIQKSQ